MTVKITGSVTAYLERRIDVFSDNGMLSGQLREIARRMIEEDDDAGTAYWLKEAAENLDGLFSDLCEVHKEMRVRHGKDAF